MGNLEASEIVAQVMHAMRTVGDFNRKATNYDSKDVDAARNDSKNTASAKRRAMTNIVFMGQGEPLYNFKNISAAIQFYNQTFSFAPWRTTISTSGLVPLMGRISSELKASLAVSLHAVNNELRDEIVPINKQYPIEELMKGVRAYLAGVSTSHTQNYRVTFEYVMLDGINDTIADARQIVRLLKGIPAHVNLIPFNSWPGAPYTCSSESNMTAFSKILFNGDIPCHIRTSRGQDIFAACGQLKTSNVSKKSSPFATMMAQ